MKNQVMSPEFWKQRISDSNDIRESVYRCSNSDWQLINDHHHQALTNTIDVWNDKVLEAGCAYGRWSPLFKNYTGVDISPDFISLAKENYSFRKESFFCYDLRELPFENDSFDWCFTISTKEMIIREVGEKTWNEMEKEILRVSKNFLILEYTESLPSNPMRNNLNIIRK